MLPCNGIYMTSYLLTIVTFAVSVAIYALFANQIKFQKFDLENEGHGQAEEKLDLHNSSGISLILY